MSNDNYYNRTQRILYPALGTKQNTTFSDVFLSVPLINSLSILGNNPVKVLYPEAVDNGFYSVNSVGEIVISKSGLYSLVCTGSFDTFDGFCQNYIELDIGGSLYKVDIKNQANAGSVVAKSNTVMSSSITLGLKTGNKISHFVSGILGSGGPNFTLLGTNGSDLFTVATLVYLSQP